MSSNNVCQFLSSLIMQRMAEHHLLRNTTVGETQGYSFVTKRNQWCFLYKLYQRCLCTEYTSDVFIKVPMMYVDISKWSVRNINQGDKIIFRCALTHALHLLALFAKGSQLCILKCIKRDTNGIYLLVLGCRKPVARFQKRLQHKKKQYVNSFRRERLWLA